MPDPIATTPQPIPAQPAPHPTRAYTTLFWFLLVGQILATFTALMAVATLLATARPVRLVRYPMPAKPTVTDTTTWESYRHSTDCYTVRFPRPYRVWGEDNLVNYNAADPRFERGNPAGVQIQIQKHTLGSTENLAAYIAQRNQSLPSQLQTAITPRTLGHFQYASTVLNGPGGRFDVFYAPTADRDGYYQALVWYRENDPQTVTDILAAFTPLTCAAPAVKAASGIDPAAYGPSCGEIVGTCNNLVAINCQAEVDGPFYYVNADSGEIIGRCGGECLRPGGCPTPCPPKEWTCK